MDMPLIVSRAPRIRRRCPARRRVTGAHRHRPQRRRHRRGFRPRRFDSVMIISLSLKPNGNWRLAAARLPAAVQTFARAGQGLAPAAADRRGAAEELGLGDAGIGRRPRGSGMAQGRNRRQRRRRDGARGAGASAGDTGRNRRGVSGRTDARFRGTSQRRDETAPALVALGRPSLQGLGTGGGGPVSP